MKKAIGRTAAMLMAAAMLGAGEHFGTGRHLSHRNPYDGESDDERRRRIHKLYGNQDQEHEFVIKGEKIMARNKKTAMKIYANRHKK